MQASTTPSGPPGERVCPGCGASNGTLAAFCWQCYRQFGNAAASASAPSGFPRAPGTYVSPASGGLRGATYGPAYASSPVPTRRGAKLGAVWMALAVLGGYFLLHSFLDRGPNAELPATVGPLVRIESPLLEQASDGFREQADGMGVDADMSFYGTGGTPGAALLWVDGSDVYTTEDAWSDFAGGISSGMGTGSVDTTRTVSRTKGGVAYRCAPIVGTPPGEVCMWDEDDVFWVLFDMTTTLSGSRSFDLAVAAHDAAA